MKATIFTWEFPPNVYGGAGVHVEFLSRELARSVQVEVRCFGDQDSQESNPRVRGYGPWPGAKENTDPRPRSLAAQILPPYLSTMRLQIASPSPVPGYSSRCSLLNNPKILSACS